MRAQVTRDEPDFLTDTSYYHIQVYIDAPLEIPQAIEWMTLAVEEYGGHIRDAEWGCWEGYRSYTIHVCFPIHRSILSVDLTRLQKAFPGVV